MILVADSGSTKTSWCLVDRHEKRWFDTEGYNPYYVDTLYIAGSLAENLPDTIAAVEISEVFYYGAGCSTVQKQIVEQALKTVFKFAQITVESDMLGAAKALLKNNAGFAAILGTGTNTCIYDGNQIINNVDSLGYMLGDEGSGSYLGKKLIRDFIRNRMPDEIRRSFEDKFKISPANIISSVYSGPLPNRYCASFSKFLSFHPGSDYVQDLIKDAFRDFFANLVSCYPDYRQYSFNACGSVAYHLSGQLREIAHEYGIQTGTIVAGPLENLVEYHLKDAGLAAL